MMSLKFQWFLASSLVILQSVSFVKGSDAVVAKNEDKECICELKDRPFLWQKEKVAR